MFPKCLIPGYSIRKTLHFCKVIPDIFLGSVGRASGLNCDLLLKAGDRGSIPGEGIVFQFNL